MNLFTTNPMSDFLNEPVPENPLEQKNSGWSRGSDKKSLELVHRDFYGRFSTGSRYFFVSVRNSLALNHSEYHCEERYSFTKTYDHNVVRETFSCLTESV